MQNEDCRLQTRGEMREKKTRKMSALVRKFVAMYENLLNMVKMYAFFSCCNRKVWLLIEV